MIRQPIITVLGHVDHGKTSLLDAIRNSRVAAKEPGAITQHIGATELPIDAVQTLAGPLLKKFGFELKIPGLLLIDTPGHEAFTNLRKRGGSIADLAILVVDAMQGIQPQTAEAIEILRAFKVPFVVAMNKIDLLNFYSSKSGSFLENLATHNERTKQLMDEKLYTLVGDLFKYGFEGERFDRCAFGKQIPIVPCSARTGEGLPELLMLLAGLSQKYLEKKLEISENESGRAAVLEAKEEKGLGKTIDVILYQGTVSVGDEIAVIGKNGILRAKIRIMLRPKPMQEMRMSKEKFNSVKQVTAAAGIKISAPGLEDVLVGSTMVVVKTGEEIAELNAEMQGSKIESHAKGVIIKADAIGSLEALVALLKKDGVQIHRAEIGNVMRKDVVEAAAFLQTDPLLACVLSFGVDVEREAVKEAELRGVRVYNHKVIYNLIEDYKAYCEEARKKQKENEMLAIVWPCEVEVLRGKVFRNTKPAIFGAHVLDGRLREGVRLMNKDGKTVGRVTGIQNEGKAVKELTRGQEAAVALDDANIGRNLFENEHLYSVIPESNFADLEKYKNELSSDEAELLLRIKKKLGYVGGE